MSFGRKDQLREHAQNVHEKLKLYECEQCSKRFEFKVNLRGHIKYLHEKPYKCEICLMKFGKKSELTAHDKKVHEKPQPYECKIEL
jgi:uncharacterized Zn-finger protein